MFFFTENALVLLFVGFRVCRKHEFGNPYELDRDISSTLRIKERREKEEDVLFATQFWPLHKLTFSLFEYLFNQKASDIYI